MAKVIKRGQVWFHNPSVTPTGHMYKGPRPVIIVSNEQLNGSSSVVLAVPCTTRIKRNFPNHVLFIMDGKVSVAMAEQAGPVNVDELVSYKFTLEGYLMDRVDDALKYVYGLAPIPPNAPHAETIVEKEESNVIPKEAEKEIEQVDENRKYNKWTILKMEEFINDYNLMSIIDVMEKYELSKQTTDAYYKKFVGMVKDNYEFNRE